MKETLFTLSVLITLFSFCKEGKSTESEKKIQAASVLSLQIQNLKNLEAISKEREAEPMPTVCQSLSSVRALIVPILEKYNDCLLDSDCGPYRGNYPVCGAKCYQCQGCASESINLTKQALFETDLYNLNETSCKTTGIPNKNCPTIHCSLRTTCFNPERYVYKCNLRKCFIQILN